MLDNSVYTQIRLAKATREELKQHGVKDSTYNEIILTLLKEKKERLVA